MARRHRIPTALVILLTTLSLAFSGFGALGVWQLYRLQWKLDLIERVETRVHADPVSAPAAPQWDSLNIANDEYRRVQLRGHFLPGHDTRVQALTALGGGFWLLSPLQRDDGSIVFINRGFVPDNWQAPEETSTGFTTITGLLRFSEPGGGFLRTNDPAANRWHSRDIDAIANLRQLSTVAPYFIDEEAAPDLQPGATLAVASDTWPRPGLTVIRFTNNHLVYALTWFALALMCLGAAVYVWRDHRQQ